MHYSLQRRTRLYPSILSHFEEIIRMSRDIPPAYPEDQEGGACFHTGWQQLPQGLCARGIKGRGSCIGPWIGVSSSRLLQRQPRMWNVSSRTSFAYYDRLIFKRRRRQIVLSCRMRCPKVSETGRFAALCFFTLASFVFVFYIPCQCI